MAFVAAVAGGTLLPAGAAQAADGPCNRTDNTWYICKTYYRGDQAIHLRVGIEYRQSGGWGYEHIKAVHGWSGVRDSWMNVTLQTGSRTLQSNGRTRFDANPGYEPGCIFSVIVYFDRISWEPAARYIETSFGNDFCSVT
jgi:hypothetical protein